MSARSARNSLGRDARRRRGARRINRRLRHSDGQKESHITSETEAQASHRQSPVPDLLLLPPLLQLLLPTRLHREAMIKKMTPSESDFAIPAKNCYRMVILGSTKVGKTAIVSRFLNGRFDEQYTPTIEDFHRKLYSIKGDVYQLDILDTSGNHPFPAMRRLSILTGRRVQGALSVLVVSASGLQGADAQCALRAQWLQCAPVCMSFQ